MKLASGAILFLGLAGVPNSSLATQAPKETPSKVTVCDLLDHRKEWDHKLVQLSGFASHGFEDSNFSDPACGRYGGLWMEYGGKLRTGTMSTVSNLDRTDSRPMKVEGINVSLTDDKMFHRFDDFLHSQPSSTVHATVIARFFAGRTEGDANGQMGGYGHLGCCSLFVIERVLEVDDHRRSGLDYSDTPEQPDASSYESLALVSTLAANLRDLHSAEDGERAFAFTDDERVAKEAIAAYPPAPKFDAKSLVLKKVSGNAYRAVYTATLRDSNRRFMVVLSRPYWLSFSAKNPKNVSWVVLAAYEVTGEEDTK
jgi:hypothetical protein